MKYCVYLSIGGEDRILIFTMDPETGKLRPHGEVGVGGSPGPLAVDAGRGFFYAGLRSTRRMVSFRLDRATGGLSLIGAVSLDADPCYIALDRRGRFLLSAYYGAGMVAVHAIGDDGALVAQPVEWRATAEHAHCIQTDPSNRFVFVPHTEPSNAIFQFRFDEKAGALTPNAIPRRVPEPGVGPRHLVFHPRLEVLYTSNEQGNSATAYRLDPSNGTLNPFQTIPTLPEGYSGKNTCAKVHMAPSGRFLYVSNRGHDSIACFAVDEATGRLTSLGQQPTEPTPRAFNLDPTGNFLFATGQGSGRLASYRIDPRSGKLDPLESFAVGKNPMWVLFLELPERA